MKKILIAIVLFTGFAFTTNAQRVLIEDANREVGYGNYEAAKKRIDEAFEDMSDKYLARGLFVKGQTYYFIAVDTLYTYLDSNAAYVALESYIKCLEAEKGERRKKYTDQVLTAQVQGVPDITNVAYVVYVKAYAHYNNRDYANTLKYWDLLIKGYEADTLGNIQKALKTSKNDVIENCAIVALNEKKNDKARKYLNTLISDPMYLSSKAYIQLSLLELEKGDTTSALEVIAKGRKKIPDDKQLFNQELNLYTELGKTNILVKKLDEVIKNEPNNILYLFYRGNIFSEEAVKLSSDAALYSDSASEARSGIKITSDPAKKKRLKEDVTKFLGLRDSGFVQAERLYAKAEKDYKEALLVDPYYYDVLFNIGVMYFNKRTMIATQYNYLDGLDMSNKKKAEDLEKEIKATVELALEYLLKAEEVKTDDYSLLHAIQQAYAQLNQMDKSMEYKKKKDDLNSK